MGQAGVAEQVVAELVAEAEQRRRGEVVLAEIAGIVGTELAVAHRRADPADRRAAQRSEALDLGVLLLVGTAQAGGEVQAFAEVPGALGEQREAVGLDLAVGLRVGVVQCAEIGAEQVQVGQRSVGGEGLVAEVLPERVGAHHVVEGTAGGRGQADLLGELPVVHFHPGVVDRRDVQLLVVGRGEVPVAVGADGGQAVAAGEVPVGLQRAAALVHADVLAAVDVDLLALRIAQRRSADQRGALPETLGGAVDHHAAVARILLVVVGDPAQAEVLVRLEQQLPARALALAAVEIVVVVDVLDVAVVAGAIGREASGEGFAERPGNRAAALEVAVLPAGDLDGALGSEGRRAGADVQHPGGGVLAEQGALRTAQQLQLLDVQQVEHGHSRPPQVDVVEVDPGAAFQAVAGGVVADAAHGDARLPRMDVGDIDAGQHLLQVLHPGDALGLESLATEHGDRRRYLLRILLAATRGDGNLAQGRIGLGRCAAGQRRRLLGGRGSIGGTGRQRTAEGEQQGQGVVGAAGRRSAERQAVVILHRECPRFRHSRTQLITKSHIFLICSLLTE